MSQPTAAIEFTDHSVLVGTTKFYEIDLKSFSAEEFLDLTDPGIKVGWMMMRILSLHLQSYMCF